MTPCPAYLDYETLIDPRYDLVSGGLVISQETFEDDNGLMAIWE